MTIIVMPHWTFVAQFIVVNYAVRCKVKLELIQIFLLEVSAFDI